MDLYAFAGAPISAGFRNRLHPAKIVRAILLVTEAEIPQKLIPNQPSKSAHDKFKTVSKDLSCISLFCIIFAWTLFINL